MLKTDDDVGLAREIGIVAASPRLARKVAASQNQEVPSRADPEPAGDQVQPRGDCIRARWGDGSCRWCPPPRRPDAGGRRATLPARGWGRKATSGSRSSSVVSSWWAPRLPSPGGRNGPGWRPSSSYRRSWSCSGSPLAAPHPIPTICSHTASSPGESWSGSLSSPQDRSGSPTSRDRPVASASCRSCPTSWSIWRHWNGASSVRWCAGCGSPPRRCCAPTTLPTTPPWGSR